MKNTFHTIQLKLSEKKAQIAILIDPDKTEHLEQLLNSGDYPDFFLVGGSLLYKGNTEATVRKIRSSSPSPVILFPGSSSQITKEADGIFLLSLISGRNPDFLIGQHVRTSFEIYNSGLECIPVGYILIDSGKPTSVSYMSNTTPIPSDKKEIVAATALAGEQLGMKMIYIENGSGADHHVSAELIKYLKQFITIPLICGGGIRTPEQASVLFAAGADILVIGTVLEENPELWLSFRKKFI
ncbi:MAG: geranylgeranylglyceryl/heptaprenylglyceryl phosphate synthase [Bacteroidia bacterium]